MKNNLQNKTKILLDEKRIPRYFYNLQPDMKKILGELPKPPLNPKTREPIRAEEMLALFPEEQVKHEFSSERYIKIPDQLIDLFRMYRPTPLIRAKRLEEYLKTPAKIYYKYEGVSPTGSHKANAALTQAYYNKMQGIKRLTTETGAGQWGSALAMAAKFCDIKLTVYMSHVSLDQKPYRRIIMEMFGAKLFNSPSQNTEVGRKIASGEKVNLLGSLGVSISEAVEDAVTHPNTKYSLGSVLNSVLMYQSVIGQEAKEQMAKIGLYPDVIVGCCGGGSNLAGIAFPFIKDKISGKKSNLRIIAVEPSECPSLTSGKYKYESGDAIGLTPLLMMYSLGKGFIPKGIHAGGLRYHGDAPLICLLYDKGVIEAEAYPEIEPLSAGLLFAQLEGIIPAPETNYAIKAVIEEAKKCIKTKEDKTILFNLSGHGLLDLAAYDDLLKGKISGQKLKGEY